MIEKYIDLTEPDAQQEINKCLAHGWRVKHSGLTLVIMEKEV